MRRCGGGFDRFLIQLLCVCLITHIVPHCSAKIKVKTSMRPTLGWNSWYALGKEAGWPITTERVILETAQALVSTGLRNAGYDTLVIDDSWEAVSRAPRPNDGLRANRKKFPHGMKYIADRLRSPDFNLTLGLYTVPGNFTCSGEVEENAGNKGALGSFGHVQADIDLWVGEWGVGYIKNCVCNTTASLRSHAYIDMKKAIERYPDHSVTYECANFMDNPWSSNEAKDRICNIWSVSDDVPDDFESWTAGVDKAVQDKVNRYAGISDRGGGWSSFDYLQVGGKQTIAEYRSQISMFAILAAPIFIGTDVRNITEEGLQVYLAKEILQVHQDSLGHPGVRIQQNTQKGYEIWVRRLRDNRSTCAWMVFNRAATGQHILVSFSTMPTYCFGPNTEEFSLRDAWEKKTLGTFSRNGHLTVNLDAHSCAVLIVSV